MFIKPRFWVYRDSGNIGKQENVLSFNFLKNRFIKSSNNDYVNFFKLPIFKSLKYSKSNVTLKQSEILYLKFIPIQKFLKQLILNYQNYKLIFLNLSDLANSINLFMLYALNKLYSSLFVYYKYINNHVNQTYLTRIYIKLTKLFPHFFKSVNYPKIFKNNNIRFNYSIFLNLLKFSTSKLTEVIKPNTLKSVLKLLLKKPRYLST